MSKFFAVFATGIVLLFGMSWTRGWELGGSKKGMVPKTVRQSPGGYRSYHFWAGGK